MSDLAAIGEIEMNGASRAEDRLPAWVGQWVGDTHPVENGIKVRSRGGVLLASARLPGVRRCNGPDLHRATAEIFGRVLQAGVRHGCPHPARVWSFIPGILEPLAQADEAQCERYMAFNAGRYDALVRHFGGKQNLSMAAPAGTGVGFGGEDLEIHVLLSARQPIAVENPLQKPSYLYSQRYGKLPPCFSRGVRLEHGGAWLLVSGTAAIRGEDTLHAGEPLRQLEITLENLRSLLKSAGAVEAEDALLERFTSVRLYAPRAAGLGELKKSVNRAFGGASVEILKAELCRGDLSVEIEGIARM